MTLSCNYVEFHQPASGCETKKVCVSSAHQKSGVGRGSLAFALLFSAFCTFLLFFTPFATPSTAPLHNPFLLPLAGTSSSLSPSLTSLLPFLILPSTLIVPFAFTHPSSHSIFFSLAPLSPLSTPLALSHFLLSPVSSLLVYSLHSTPLHSTPFSHHFNLSIQPPPSTKHATTKQKRTKNGITEETATILLCVYHSLHGDRHRCPDNGVHLASSVCRRCSP